MMVRPSTRWAVPTLQDGYFLALALTPVPSAPGSLKGTAFTNLVTAPLRMHCVQTRIDLFVPLTVTRTRCKLGLNCRLLNCLLR